MISKRDCFRHNAIDSFKFLNWLGISIIAYLFYPIYKVFKASQKSNQVTSDVNPLSAKPTKWSNTLKQFVGKLPTNCLSVLDHFVGLALKELTQLKS